MIATPVSKSHAQAAGSDVAETSGGLEEITVTARKREEKLLDVPIAITAFSAKTIEAEGITSIEDLAQFTPGLNYDGNIGGSGRNDRSFPEYIIRGMVPFSSTDPNTTVFLNGAPVTSGQVEGIEDIDRIEVLKGPQSAYFGRSTFAGAINFITKDPSNTFQGSIDALIGSRNWRDIRAVLEGPVVDGKLDVRATFRDYARDGSYGNQAAPGAKASNDQTLGDQSTRSGTFEALLTPTDNLKIKAFGMMWEDADGPSAQGVLLAKDPLTGKAILGNCYNNTYICGTLPSLPAGTPAANTLVDSYIQNYINQAQGPLQQIEPLPSQYGLQRQAYHYSVGIEYYFESLGITVNSLTSGNRQEYSELQDLDNQDTSKIPNPYAAFIPGDQLYYNWPFNVEERRHDFSQELRLTSEQDQPFRWLAGVSYEHVHYDDSLGQGGPFGLSNYGSTANESTTYGGFIGLAYDILSDLTLDFDARYQVDKVSSFAPLTTLQDAGYVHSFIPRTSLQYKINPDVMVYATYSEGANPPVFNATLATLTAEQRAYVESLGATPLIKPETLKNYEAGVKGRFWGGMATLSADIYYDIWTNQIVAQTIFVPNLDKPPTQESFNTNLGKSTLKGIEIEGTIAPVDHLVIDGSGAINDTRIDQYQCALCAATTGSSYVGGKQLPNVSKYSAHVGLQYSDIFPYINDASWYARLDYTFKSGVYDTAANLAQTPDQNVVNLKAGLIYGPFQFEAFIDNVNNDTAFTSIQPNYDEASLGETFARYDAIIVGLPNLRTFGGRVKYRFGGESAETPPPSAPYAPPPVVAPASLVAHNYMVFFDFDKSDLTPEATSIVDQAARNAGPAKATELTVTGHTDTVGSDAYNMRLSRRRAESVAGELEVMGIKASEIEIVAKGKHDLLVPTKDGVKEPQNRRVTIVYGGASS
jgi:iron complex outermembrane receptor protein